MSDISAILKYPKNPVLVELLLEGGESKSVEIYVEVAENEFPRQQVVDLLENDLQFLPAREVDEKQVFIFNKAKVVWVSMSLVKQEDAMVEKLSDAIGSELFDIHRQASVGLISAPALEGNILYSAPSELRRLNDFLNLESRFFCLWTAEHLYIINKSYVKSVRELAEEKPQSGREHVGTDR